MSSSNRRGLSGGGAPTDARYWTGAANGSLSAEENVGALANGAILKNNNGSPAAAVADTDYLVGDVIDTQSQGSAVQTITIPVAGNTDEGIVIVGSGHAAVSHNITVGINDDATPPTYTTLVNSNGANSAETARIAASYVGPLNFVLEIDARVHDSDFRTGLMRTWIVDNAGANRDIYIGMFRWPVTTGEITSVLIKGGAAGLFASGFKTKARRRKVT